MKTTTDTKGTSYNANLVDLGRMEKLIKCLAYINKLGLAHRVAASVMGECSDPRVTAAVALVGRWLDHPSSVTQADIDEARKSVSIGIEPLVTWGLPWYDRHTREVANCLIDLMDTIGWQRECTWPSQDEWVAGKVWDVLYYARYADPMGAAEQRVAQLAAAGG